MVWYVSTGLYLLELFKTWIHTLVVTPIQTKDMLWILVPVWLAWFFAEFFQEKTGTSIGNAMTNAIVIVWGSIDCTRQTVRLMSEGVITNQWNIAARFTLIAFIMMYGMIIIILGWKGNQIIKYIGRVREVTYVFAMFVPIFYNAISFSVEHIVSALLFFPLFYYVIEMIDKYTPNPKAITEDEERAKGESSAFGRGELGGLGGVGENK